MIVIKKNARERTSETRSDNRAHFKRLYAFEFECFNGNYIIMHYYPSCNVITSHKPIAKRT